ncbi:MAG: C10 family peptidase [Prevotella sp.]
MKLLLSILLVFSFSLSLRSKVVNVDKAKALAENFMSQKKSKKVSFRLISTDMTAKSKGDKTESPYYIFNEDDNNGFVIVSAEDRLPSIIGYSLCGSISNEMPEALKLFLQSYSEYVDDIRNGSVFPNIHDIEISNGLPNAVEPLVAAQWDQMSPYNKYTPAECPVGCVAVAMAQIMHYYKWPNVGNGSGSAIYDGKAISVDFTKSNYEWDAMKTTTKELEEDETAADAVAKLLYDAGVAAKMEYTSTSSGSKAQNAMNALMANFGYKASTLRYSSPEYFETTGEWLDIVFSELANGRPVYYQGYSPSTGSSRDSYHAFVISGYDESGRVHVNWGWGGSCDGYYDIGRLDPVGSKYAYTNMLAMVYGIEPAYDGEPGIYSPTPYMGGEITVSVSEVGCSAAGSESFSVNYPQYGNRSAVSGKWSIGIGIYDAGEKFISKIQVGNISKTIGVNQYYIGGAFSCSLPANLSDGEYVLKMFFKADGEFVEPDVVGGKAKNYLRVVIANGRATFDRLPATAINKITNESNEPTLIFDLNGVVRGNDIDALPHGIYFREGKKIVR